MVIEQLYTGCLAEAAYYIESEGEAIIIDPLRETEPYIRKAEKAGAKIKYIFETHFHADFVSGHIDLAAKTGAEIIFGPGAETGFKSYSAKDNEEFVIGKITIKVLHTPGHTLESSSFLLKDETGKDLALFTGDTLFIGDVGRPDLAIQSGLTEKDLAGMLYDSLHHKILPLDDDIIIYPAHGAGSACGKNMSKETFDTLGHQKKVNYALQHISKEEFIKKLTEGITPAPGYFSFNAEMNKSGYKKMDLIKEKGLRKLDPQALEDLATNFGAMILDTRNPADFGKAFIPGSINIGLDGQFAPWVGALITDIYQPILFVSEAGKEEEVIKRLTRVGYDNILGFLEGGIESWKQAAKPLDQIQSVTSEDLTIKAKEGSLNIIDVRKKSEFDEGHVKTALNLPLEELNEWTSQVDRNKHYYIHCAGGYRSMITASILKARGFEKIADINGGFNAISKSNLPIEK